MLASRSCILRVSSSCRLIWIFVYSSVIRTVLSPAATTSVTLRCKDQIAGRYFARDE